MAIAFRDKEKAGNGDDSKTHIESTSDIDSEQRDGEREWE